MSGHVKASSLAEHKRTCMHSVFSPVEPKYRRWGSTTSLGEARRPVVNKASPASHLCGPRRQQRILAACRQRASCTQAGSPLNGSAVSVEQLHTGERAGNGTAGPGIATAVGQPQGGQSGSAEEGALTLTAVAAGHQFARVWPEEFVLAPGELSEVNRVGRNNPADVWRCSSCSLEACQGPDGCQQLQWRHAPGGYLREILTARVYDVAEVTPLEEARGLSEQLGATLLLKREDLQPVFSFKLRGAFNKMASLSDGERSRGVICSSAGNHAQGVALAARTLGCRAVICMPLTTPEIKIAAVKKLGGEVELVGQTYSETQIHAQIRARTEGLVFVAPYDDPYTIAGQGTIGVEVLRQCTASQLNRLRAIFVPVGGGGLVAGIAAYIKALKPDIKVIGVEPVGANGMAVSLARGERVELGRVDAFADGVAVKLVGAETFRLCRNLVDGIVLVDNASISAAIKDVFNETRSILEPAGAVAVAGAKAYLKRHDMQGSVAVAVTSGANMNFERLRLVSELADIGSRQEAMLATTIAERPGAFAHFIETALASTELQVTEFKYRYSAGTEAHVLWSVGISSSAQLQELITRLVHAKLPTTDISALEEAQVHLRHLAGGRARSYTGGIPSERIFNTTFPERPGALRKFLQAVSPTWNITLFHYRKTGNRSSNVLIGIQVPPEDSVRFKAAVGKLAEDFTFTELAGEARRVFDMFIH